MRTIAYTLVIGSILLAAATYLYSPHLARALIDPTYTPAYWAR